jgi:cytochrome P450
LDEASEFLFGATVDALKNEQTEFSTAFNYAQTLTAWRFRIPFWRYILPRRRMMAEIKKLDDFVYKIIDDARVRQTARAQEKKESGKEDVVEDGRHDTLLDHFLSQQDEEGFDSKYLRDMLLNFLLAGRDTVRLCSFLLL